MLFSSLFDIFPILMPPSCGSTQGADRYLDSVWPSRWYFVYIDASEHTEESEVALDVFMQFLESNCSAQLLIEVGLVSGKLHMSHKVGRFLLVQQPSIAKTLNKAALCHEITLLHMLGSQTVFNRPWEQLNVIQIKFSTFHIVYFLVNKSARSLASIYHRCQRIGWLVGYMSHS